MLGVSFFKFSCEKVHCEATGVLMSVDFGEILGIFSLGVHTEAPGPPVLMPVQNWLLQ